MSDSDSRRADALSDAHDIWRDAILPERVEARNRAAAFARDSDEELIRLILDTSDEERILDNKKFIAAALVYLRRNGIDEHSM